MKALFKKNNDKPGENNAPVPNAIARQFAKGYSFVQMKWAKWMARKTSKWSKRKLTATLVFFCFVTGAYSTYLIVYSLLTHVEATSSITTTKISRQAALSKTIAHKSGAVITDEEMDRIIAFRHYLDSLKTTASGTKSYDSIVQNCSGLLDSLTIVENYYYRNLKH
ncbi:hypothetical protein Q765_13665 [Flavobacterium rivuli WB 3.3-2 = DSM 21788]|uniref:Uncharacterized protein n=1 Tax=Flavobacterium rivuli WB 3.3-2 = DSM 21788 TaxID=1121895 RepID=A0A0A2M0S5_9FLAO|nr:hypothetical protein [Flavobacterium rivuli]KGO85879.1 hypothetical protein Q765_13665 [Flavobacterium rivuli WB 3.3-2 = DSM 21788]